MKIFDFEVTRTLRAEVMCHEGKHYLRTREVAQVLGVKQQYEFNADIKRSLGSSAIIKGEDSLEFRGEDDTDRTTFISAKNLIKFLYQGGINHKMIQGKKEETINALIKLIIKEGKC